VLDSVSWGFLAEPLTKGELLIYAFLLIQLAILYLWLVIVHTFNGWLTTIRAPTGFGKGDKTVPELTSEEILRLAKYSSALQSLQHQKTISGTELVMAVRTVSPEIIQQDSSDWALMIALI